MAYVLLLLLLVIFQRALIYFPEKFYVPPDQAGASSQFKEWKVTTSDNLVLTGWYAPAQSKRFTIIFFHGNADNLRSVVPIATPYLAHGYGFLLAEYRGYSGNPGQPSEAGLYNDARAFLRSLLASGVNEKDIVLYGHSLGSGVAVQMAGELHTAGLILESPYMSLARMAQVRFPVFPAEFLAADRFENFKKIPALHQPLLLAYGEKDRVIPILQAQQLYALAPEPKTLFVSPEAGHHDLSQHGFIEAALKWLEELSGHRRQTQMPAK